eukprot:scaffold3806_cov169-Amphora_coffeaeformis.AAC.1
MAETALSRSFIRWRRCLIALFVAFAAVHILPPPCYESLVLSSGNRAVAPTWQDVQIRLSSTAMCSRLKEEAQLRSQGRGSPHIGATLRLFDEVDMKDDEMSTNKEEMQSASCRCRCRLRLECFFEKLSVAGSSRTSVENLMP